jgi:predicted nucleotidyltransferase
MMKKAEINELRDALQMRRENEAAELKLLREKALEAARQAARLLREKYHAQKVFLYGSLAWSKHFDRHSDIDLLIEGCSEVDNYWRMVNEVEEITAPFQPSVVLSEDASSGLRAKVYDKGVILE